MNRHNLTIETELTVKSRKAAFCARRRLIGADLSAQDMEDMIQATTLAYWRNHREGRSIPF